jgi:hypothetical protein
MYSAPAGMPLQGKRLLHSAKAHCVALFLKKRSIGLLCSQHFCDTLLQDIDHMNNRFQTLTLDSQRFPVRQMRALVDKMNAAGQQWVPIHVS